MSLPAGPAEGKLKLLPLRMTLPTGGKKSFINRQGGQIMHFQIQTAWGTLEDRAEMRKYGKNEGKVGIFTKWFIVAGQTCLSQCPAAYRCLRGRQRKRLAQILSAWSTNNLCSERRKPEKQTQSRSPKSPLFWEIKEHLQELASVCVCCFKCFLGFVG